MISINDIVLQVYTDRRIKEFIGRLNPSDLREDLMHHCVLEIYRIAEKEPGKVEALASRGNELFGWFTGMVHLQLESKTSTFYRKFRRCFADEKHIEYSNPVFPAFTEPQKELTEAEKWQAEQIYQRLESGKTLQSEKKERKEKEKQAEKAQISLIAAVSDSQPTQYAAQREEARKKAGIAKRERLKEGKQPKREQLAMF